MSHTFCKLHKLGYIGHINYVAKQDSGTVRQPLRERESINKQNEKKKTQRKNAASNNKIDVAQDDSHVIDINVACRYEYFIWILFRFPFYPSEIECNFHYYIRLSLIIKPTQPFSLIKIE